MTYDDMPSRPRPWRRRVQLVAWMAVASAICARAVQIQVVQGAEWREIAAAQHRSHKSIVAERGTVLDRDGAALAVTRERYRIGIAPRELGDPVAARAALVEAVGVTPAEAERLTSLQRDWSVVPGHHPPTVRERLEGIRGMYVDRELQRYHPHGDLARGVLGAVIDGLGRGGVEQAFEHVLRGTPGREVFARDNVGRRIPGERLTIAAPISGGQVVLTLDMDLQEIARQALEDAIHKSQARGGDVLVTEPRTGEILALVSIRDGRTAALSAINTPYEPGSTLKPFTVAGLLGHSLASLSDTVDVEDGRWRVAGRTLTDVAAEGRMSIADALRVSSNVGIAKAAQVMPRGVQYENLRDFGFGAPTGIEIPGEVAGTLRRPTEWSRQSPASLAIGYEISVTPLQMAMAYGALANGGRLMEPRLVREIRGPDGTLVREFGPRTVRRVVSPEVARLVSRVLVDAVEDGTGTAARLGSFAVAGKSGTARLYSPSGGYERGAYWSSFVGFFPADDPQLVVFVKLERPKGRYYGGAVAAPVTRATMEAALAARATPLDRAALLRSVRGPSLPLGTPVRFAARPIDPPAPPAGDVSGVVPMNAQAEAGDPMGIDAHTDGLALLVGGVPVPEVTGLPSRVAARRLHALGLRVAYEGTGTIAEATPASGTRVLPGDTVRLRVRGQGDG